jgi:tripartite-type tricarboxylate transporter receptor subunit TctC
MGVMRHLAALLAAFIAGSAFAQGYPSRTVRIVVPNAPGGPTDIVARIMAQRMPESMGQAVIVENRLGAGGTVGTESVARSAPDGYTVLFSAAGAMVITPHMNPKLPYDTFRDFSPVALGASMPLVLTVGPNSTMHSVQDLITQARAQPGRLNYSTAGIGTPPHLAAELMKATAGIDIVHIPYRGAPQSQAAVLNGEVAFSFTQPTVMNLVRAGKIRALAISSAKRSPLAPELPTLSEAGLPGFEVIPWYGAFAPAKVPEDVLAKINAEMIRALRQPDVVERLQSLGFEPPVAHTAADFAAFVRKESAKWQKVVKDANIKAE